MISSTDPPAAVEERVRTAVLSTHKQGRSQPRRYQRHVAHLLLLLPLLLLAATIRQLCVSAAATQLGACCVFPDDGIVGGGRAAV